MTKSPAPHRRPMAVLLAATLAVGSAVVGLGGTASAVVPDVLNDPPVAPYVVTTFPARDFVSATGFAEGSTVDVEVWRDGTLAGWSNDLVPSDVPATPGFDGLVEVNHPGAACWTNSTPDVKPGDLVRLVEHVPATATTPAQIVAQQTPVANIVITTAVNVVAPDTVQVRGIAMDAAGDPLPIADISHEFIASTADPFDATGTRRIVADSTGAFQGVLAYDTADPTGTTWVATYTQLSAHDVAHARDVATSSAQWLGRNPLAGTESTIYEYGEQNGPQTPCTAPKAGPAASAQAAVLFPAAQVGAAAGVAPEMTVTVTNNGVAPFGDLHTTSVSASGDYSVVSETCSAAVVAIGGTCDVVVRFSPTVEGRRDGVLTMVSDSVNGNLQVALVGVATAPAAGAVPFLYATHSLIDFGTRQPLLVSPATTITFTNIGTAEAALAAPALGGTNAADWTIVAGGTCGATLAVGASCSVAVTFAPSAETARTATLTLGVTGAAASVVQLKGAGLITTGVIEPPSAGHLISAFVSRDFVSTAGFSPDRPVIIQVVRHNVVVGTTEPFFPGPDGIAEVNHPGAACWAGTTPNIRGGDKVRVIDGDGSVYQIQVADLNMAGAPTSPAPGTVVVKGSANDNGVRLSIDALGVELITSTANAYELNGRRLISAPGDGLIAFDPIDPVTNPTGFNWTATFTGLSDADVLRATQQATPTLLWLGRDPGLLTEETIYEFGEVNGPQAPCTAPAAAPDADLTVPVSNVQFAVRQAPRTGFAGTSTTSDITVKSSGIAPLVISNVAVAGTNAADFTQVATAGSCPLNAPIAVGTSCIVRVRFAPQAVGNRTAQLVLRTNVVGTPSYVNLAGRGSAAAESWATPTPSSLSFIERGVNLFTTSRLTLVNSGEASMTVSIPTGAISGTNAADFSISSNGCTGSVLPGGSCAVIVRFRPTAVGSRVGQLTITTNNANRGSIVVPLSGLSLTNGGYNDPPLSPRLIGVFPVRDYVFTQGFDPSDFVTIQVLRAGQVIGETAPASPVDDPRTLGFDGIVEVNHVGGLCWVGNTPDIKPGDIVRTRATDALGVTKIRNGSRVQDQTIVQGIVVTQLPVQTAPGVVKVKGYGSDMLVAGQRLAPGSVEVRLVSKTGFFEVNGRGNVRADSTGALQGLVAFEGTTNNWVATFSGLSPADVALALDPATSAVALWLGRNVLGGTEATHYEWGEIPGAQPPCDTGDLAAPLTVGEGRLTPRMPGILGEGGFLDFGIVSRTAPSQTRTVTLSNIGFARMTVSSIRTDLGLDTTNFVVAPGGDNCTGVGLDPGASCTVTVQVAPPASGATAGTHWGALVMYSDGADSPHQTILKAEVPPAPVITAVGPAQTARGTTVTITGTGLVNVSEIRFVGTNAAAGIGTLVAPTASGVDPTVVGTAAEGTRLWATLPADSVHGGTYAVQVTTLGGTVTSAGSITAFGTAPSLGTFTPAAGAPGTTVTITGRNFTNGLVPASPIVSAVSFGGVPAASFTVVNDTTMTAVAPAGGIDGRIAVTTPLGTVTSVGVWDAYGLPTVVAASVNPVRPGTAVTLTGSELLGLRSVTLNGAAIAGATVNATGTSITFTVPTTATNGPLVITARGGAGTSNLLQVSAAPTITSFTPTSAGAGVGAVVTVNGRNYVGVTSVTVGGVAAPFTVVNTNVLTFVVPVGATTGRLSITAAFGRVNSATNFTVIPRPTITAFTPLQGGAGVRVTISGTNLAGTTAVTIGGRVVTTFVSRTATSVVITTPTGMTPGLAPIRVDTPGGSAVSATAFRAL